MSGTRQRSIPPHDCRDAERAYHGTDDCPRHQTMNGSRPPCHECDNAADCQAVHAARRQGIKGSLVATQSKSGSAGQGCDQAPRADQECATGTAEENHNRPDQVEMLLNSQRPQMAESGQPPVASPGVVDVRCIQPQPSLMSLRFRERENRRRDDQWQQHQEAQNYAIIKRENPQNSADVKITKVARLVFHVQQDTGNKKSGQYEEQIDTVVAHAKYP